MRWVHRPVRAALVGWLRLSEAAGDIARSVLLHAHLALIHGVVLADAPRAGTTSPMTAVGRAAGDGPSGLRSGGADSAAWRTPIAAAAKLSTQDAQHAKRFERSIVCFLQSVSFVVSWHSKAIARSTHTQAGATPDATAATPASTASEDIGSGWGAQRNIVAVVSPEIQVPVGAVFEAMQRCVPSVPRSDGPASATKRRK